MLYSRRLPAPSITPDHHHRARRIRTIPRLHPMLACCLHLHPPLLQIHTCFGALFLHRAHHPPSSFNPYQRPFLLRKSAMPQQQLPFNPIGLPRKLSRARSNSLSSPPNGVRAPLRGSGLLRRSSTSPVPSTGPSTSSVKATTTAHSVWVSATTAHTATPA
jgi:hypothetical protein